MVMGGGRGRSAGMTFLCLSTWGTLRLAHTLKSARTALFLGADRMGGNPTGCRGPAPPWASKASWLCPQ